MWWYGRHGDSKESDTNTQASSAHNKTTKQVHTTGARCARLRALRHETRCLYSCHTTPHHTLLTGLAHLPQLQGGEDPQDAWARGKRRGFSPGASRAPQRSGQSSTDCNEPVFPLFFHCFRNLTSPHLKSDLNLMSDFKSDVSFWETSNFGSDAGTRRWSCRLFFDKEPQISGLFCGK